jgi:hypothetical protein
MMNPNKQDRKLRINFANDEPFNIKSDLIKRLELQHIEETIKSLSIILDFGFEMMYTMGDSFKG